MARKKRMSLVRVLNEEKRKRREPMRVPVDESPGSQPMSSGEENPQQGTSHMMMSPPGVGGRPGLSPLEFMEKYPDVDTGELEKLKQELKSAFLEKDRSLIPAGVDPEEFLSDLSSVKEFDAPTEDSNFPSEWSDDQQRIQGAAEKNYQQHGAGPDPFAEFEGDEDYNPAQEERQEERRWQGTGGRSETPGGGQMSMEDMLRQLQGDSPAPQQTQSPAVPPRAPVAMDQTRAQPLPQAPPQNKRK